jgi:hypothetical protein
MTGLALQIDDRPVLLPLLDVTEIQKVMSVCDLSRDYTRYRKRIIAVRGVLQAASKGTFFNRHVRNQFCYQRLA